MPAVGLAGPGPAQAARASIRARLARAVDCDFTYLPAGQCKPPSPGLTLERMFDILGVTMLTARSSSKTPPSDGLFPREGVMLLEAAGDLAGALQQLAQVRGESPEAVAADLLRQALEREDRRRQAEAALASLTPRQRQIARLAAEGRTNRDIARALWLSPETVKTHLRRALERFGVHSKSELRLQLSDLVASDEAAG